jgi:predicted PurR-regulated permease PerM
MATFSLDQFYRLNRRALTWIILFALIWLMRNFFGLIFLTFILAFISTPLAGFAQRHLRLSRRLSIVAVYGCFLIAIGAFAFFVTPRTIKESQKLISTLPQIEERLLTLKGGLIERHPSLNPLITGFIRSVLPEEKLTEVNQQLAELNSQLDTRPGANGAAPSAARPSTAATVPPAPANASASTPATADEPTSATSALFKAREDELLLKAFMNVQAGRLRERAPWLINLLWRSSATMVLALLFSFLITLDISRLGQELRSLRSSRLREFYEQAAQPVIRFAYVLGRAFQAQAVIACANALLTMIGLLVLGIPSMAMLSVIVFVCSFIPVLGVFISTTPIVLVALNGGGLGKAVAAIVLVAIIHAVEAYLLNPLIYGKHLKLNPVLVLMILFVGHHAFGLWGMLLGVPVAYYLIHDVFDVPVWGETRLPPKAKPLGELPQGNAAHAGPAEAREESAARVGAKKK